MIDRDNIIRMARQCKMPYHYPTGEIVGLEKLEQFAAMVAAMVAAIEREACAQIADEAGPYTAADLIRARGRS